MELETSRAKYPTTTGQLEDEDYLPSAPPLSDLQERNIIPQPDPYLYRPWAWATEPPPEAQTSQGQLTGAQDSSSKGNWSVSGYFAISTATWAASGVLRNVVIPVATWVATDGLRMLDAHMQSRMQQLKAAATGGSRQQRRQQQAPQQPHNHHQGPEQQQRQPRQPMSGAYAAAAAAVQQHAAAGNGYGSSGSAFSPSRQYDASSRNATPWQSPSSSKQQQQQQSSAAADPAQFAHSPGAAGSSSSNGCGGGYSPAAAARGDATAEAGAAAEERATWLGYLSSFVVDLPLHWSWKREGGRRHGS